MKWKMRKRKDGLLLKNIKRLGKDESGMFLGESNERREFLGIIRGEGSKRKGRGRKIEMENE